MIKRSPLFNKDRDSQIAVLAGTRSETAAPATSPRTGEESDGPDGSEKRVKRAGEKKGKRQREPPLLKLPYGLYRTYE